MALPKWTEERTAELTNFVGDEGHPVTGMNEIHRVENGDLVFVDHPKYYSKALESAATTIVIDKEVDCPPGKALIISSAPFDDYNRLTRHFSVTASRVGLMGNSRYCDLS